MSATELRNLQRRLDRVIRNVKGIHSASMQSLDELSVIRSIVSEQLEAFRVKDADERPKRAKGIPARTKFEQSVLDVLERHGIDIK